MTASDRLDEIRARYVEWHSNRGEGTSAPDDWPDADWGESMDHYIVRNDVPAMHVALRTILDLHQPVRVYAASSVEEVFAALEFGADPLAVVCRECSNDEVDDAIEDFAWDDSMGGTVHAPCATYRAAEAALGVAS